MPLPKCAANGSRCCWLTRQRSAEHVGLIANVPVRRPCQLAKAADAARLRHAGQAEIEPVGEQSGHQDVVVSSRFAGAQMGEQSGNSVQRGHLGQQVGDADSRQHGVEPAANASASGGVDFSIGAILSTPLVIVTSGSVPVGATGD